MFKSLTFDGENSLDYGVHINGEGVYNAPERDVEMISIPGRDGDYALDHGRFHNIDVTYPAGIGEMSQTDFADKIGVFRNALASRRGYCRLEDDYHPDEFRMGVYKSGLEASPVMYNRAGEFDLVFNCKPQRFLKSGEQATEFTASGTITNPTLFESKPLLELYGYGTLNVNGSEIVLHNEPIGETVLVNKTGIYSSQTITFPANLVNNGDSISLSNFELMFRANRKRQDEAFEVYSAPAGTATNATITSERADISAGAETPYMRATIGDVTFTVGTNKTARYTRQIRLKVTRGSEIFYSDWKVTYSIQYTGAPKNKFIINFSHVIDTHLTDTYNSMSPFKATADSTVLPLGSPLYLDCEIGEAYKETGGEITLINKNVDIPSDLPTLSPGANTITMDNTFTKVNVIPRWWII